MPEENEKTDVHISTDDDAGKSTEKEKKEVSLTESQVKRLLEDQERKWQSRFDKVLAEKKEIEATEKTAEQRIADIERKYEEERLGRVRERAINSAGLDAELVAAATDLVGSDAENIATGAERIKSALESRIESEVKKRVEDEVAKRFKATHQPKTDAGENGEVTYQQLLAMSDEQVKALPKDVFEKAMQNKG